MISMMLGSTLKLERNLKIVLFLRKLDEENMSAKFKKPNLKYVKRIGAKVLIDWVNVEKCLELTVVIGLVSAGISLVHIVNG